jgi:glyoxylase-like metal-dependent hydrolase (beta-lactamase superfamily II)
MTHPPVVTGRMLLAACAWSSALQSQEPLAIRTEVLLPGYVVISGYTNGNILAVIGDSGVLLVDGQSARRVPQADSALRTFTRQPVRWVVNTHYHADHIEGNAHWRGQGAVVLAHDRVRVEAVKDTTVTELTWHRQPAAPGALPAMTFSEQVTLHLPTGPVVIVHPAPAHTGGDAIVWFPAANIVHVGDIVEVGAPPFIDWWTGGSLDGTIAVTDSLIAAVNDSTRIVPGHGAVIDRTGLRTYRQMLGTIRDRLTQAIAAGKTLDEIHALRITAEYDQRLGGERRGREFVRHWHVGLTR